MEQINVKINKVMAAIDLSKYSEDVFANALTLARSLGAELILLNIINSRGLDYMDRLGSQGYDISSDKFVEGATADRIAEFEKDYLPKTGDVPARLVIKVGLPYEEILKAIKEEGADMLVMGPRGHTALAGTLLGTSAEKVFRRATCTVISVRCDEHSRLLDRI